MEKELCKFYKNLEVLSKELSEYTDEKGNYMILPTPQLFVGCEYVEVETDKENIAKFENIIDKDLEYNKIKTTKTLPKSEVTGNKKDSTTIIEKEIEVYQIWLVKNNLGMKKSFNKLDEALKVSKEINDKLLKKML